MIHHVDRIKLLIDFRLFLLEVRQDLQKWILCLRQANFRLFLYLLQLFDVLVVLLYRNVKYCLNVLDLQLHRNLEFVTG